MVGKEAQGWMDTFEVFHYNQQTSWNFPNGLGSLKKLLNFSLFEKTILKKLFLRVAFEKHFFFCMM